MGVLLSDEEKQSLRRDLVGPVKSFLREVGDDTVGDAKKFYTARARETEKSVRRAQAQTREKLAAIRREQEELKKHRQAMMKRAAIILALLALFSFLTISAALNAHADAEPYTQGAVYREPSFRCVSAGEGPAPSGTDEVRLHGKGLSQIPLALLRNEVTKELFF